MNYVYLLKKRARGTNSNGMQYDTSTFKPYTSQDNQCHHMYIVKEFRERVRVQMELYGKAV